MFFPFILKHGLFLCFGSRYDPNWTSLIDQDGQNQNDHNHGLGALNEMEIDDAADVNGGGGGGDAEEQETTGWTDDDGDSWGNDDDDDDDDGDGFTNDLGVAAADHKEDGFDLTELQELDSLNQHLDDDGDSSWKVRRASNKCILAMIGVLEETARDFNPNMFRVVAQECARRLVLLLVRRCSERVLRIQLAVFESLNAKKGASPPQFVPMVLSLCLSPGSNLDIRTTRIRSNGWF